jgi:hypothetical protein
MHLEDMKYYEVEFLYFSVKFDFEFYQKKVLNLDKILLEQRKLFFLLYHFF